MLILKHEAGPLRQLLLRSNSEVSPLTNFGRNGGRMRLEGAFHIALPVALEAMVQVPIDCLLQAHLPWRCLLPSQGCQFLVADVVPESTNLTSRGCAILVPDTAVRRATALFRGQYIPYVLLELPLFIAKAARILLHMKHSRKQQNSLEEAT